MRIERGHGWTLRLGRWQDVLDDVECDAMISDPPYSARTHRGAASNRIGGEVMKTLIDYSSMSEGDAVTFANHWHFKTKSWCVAIEDHITWQIMISEWARLGRYTFAPVPFVEPWKSPRVTGDGPASWSCYVAAARPKQKRFSQWGSLPGAYVESGGGRKREMLGGKPEWLMRALVRDYSLPGDLVCDPCAGAGTTLLAAITEGRRAIGAECDPATFELAVKRLRKGCTPDLFSIEPTTQTQTDMFKGES